ncbi:uncharacterized protein PpBr36_09632 [Pyricularia pennisetigena]|uniref:uncharacterized protein n=1 Tax=Pyricularia pennisetigena TaxID=1578925 RepID=UPI001153A141|nr:uncharacterized protein PpBr36_09632 [Pyricularia pennisetigena]TLS21845.1 hypothetical protein PpBr36_09632 [Pyricularia pennisetigena]
MVRSASTLFAIVASLSFQKFTSAVPISGLDRTVMSYGLTTRDIESQIPEVLSRRDDATSPETRGKELLDLHQKAIKDNVADSTTSSDKKDATGFDPSDPLKRPLVFPDTMSGLVHGVTKVSLPDWRVIATEWEAVRDFSKDDMDGFEPSGKARRIKLQQSHDKAVVEGLYGEDGDFMALSTAHSSRADKDVPVFEMVWQSFADVAGDKVKNLKAIYLMDLASDDFKKVAELNYEDTKQDKERKVTWEIKNNPRPKRFQRFVGADPVSGMLMMLMNHHQKLGNKEVTKIITMPAKGSRDLSKVTVALILEDAK